MRRREFVGLSTAVLTVGGCASVTGAPDAAKSALAPSGALRFGFLLGPIYATQDAASGRYRGVAVDLGTALAARLGVPLETLAQPGIPALLAGASAGQFDVLAMGVTAERAAVIDFTPPYMVVEQGLLARAGLAATQVEDVDRSELRIGVLQKSGADTVLTRQLKQATLVRAPDLDQLFALLAAGGIDLAAATKSRLFEETQKIPGSVVLAGSILTEPIALGVPKGRAPAAAQFLAAFVEAATAQGLVARAIANHQLRGVRVAARA